MELYVDVQAHRCHTFNSFKSKTIPTLKEGFAALAKRCEGCRPLGMFRSKEHEFLLCYDGQYLLFICYRITHSIR